MIRQLDVAVARGDQEPLPSAGRRLPLEDVAMDVLDPLVVDEGREPHRGAPWLGHRRGACSTLRRRGRCRPRLATPAK